MKKINSNGYGHKILGWAALFLIGVPLFLCALEHALPVALRGWIDLSLAVGLMITAFFILLLSVEFYQDRKIDRGYAAIRKEKMPLGNGQYECQACGNRQLTHADNACGICGTTFAGKGDSPA